jgi:hypothetical protein
MSVPDDDMPPAGGESANTPLLNNGTSHRERVQGLVGQKCIWNQIAGVKHEIEELIMASDFRARHDLRSRWNLKYLNCPWFMSIVTGDAGRLPRVQEIIIILPRERDPLVTVDGYAIMDNDGQLIRNADGKIPKPGEKFLAAGDSDNDIRPRGEINDDPLMDIQPAWPVFARTGFVGVAGVVVNDNADFLHADVLENLLIARKGRRVLYICPNATHFFNLTPTTTSYRSVLLQRLRLILRGNRTIAPITLLWGAKVTPMQSSRTMDNLFVDVDGLAQLIAMDQVGGMIMNHAVANVGWTNVNMLVDAILQRGVGPGKRFMTVFGILWRDGSFFVDRYGLDRLCDVVADLTVSKFVVSPGSMRAAMRTIDALDRNGNIHHFSLMYNDGRNENCRIMSIYSMYCAYILRSRCAVDIPVDDKVSAEVPCMHLNILLHALQDRKYWAADVRIIAYPLRGADPDDRHDRADIESWFFLYNPEMSERIKLYGAFERIKRPEVEPDSPQHIPVSDMMEQLENDYEDAIRVYRRRNRRG